MTAVTVESIRKLMSEFGIGRAAARYHMRNAWYGQAELPPEYSIGATPTDEQKAAEDSTQDFFPIKETPVQRRGRFAMLVAEAARSGLITADTSAQYLACREEEFEKALPHLLDLA